MIIPAILALAAATTPAEPMKPAGKWIVDYRPDMCVVGRSFGTEASPTIFALKPSISMDSKSTDLFVLAPLTGDKGIHRGDATVTFEPSGITRKLAYVSWVPNGTRVRGYEVPLAGDGVDTLRQSTGVQISAGKDSFAMETGKIEPVMAALATCTDDLFSSWGVDPKAKAAPNGSPGNWFTDDDYPSDARRRDATGGVTILLTVDPDGGVADCRVVVSSKDKSLDDTSCTLARRRGRFEKAAATGNRFAILSIRWVLLGS